MIIGLPQCSSPRVCVFLDLKWILRNVEETHELIVKEWTLNSLSIRTRLEPHTWILNWSTFIHSPTKFPVVWCLDKWHEPEQQEKHDALLNRQAQKLSPFSFFKKAWHIGARDLNVWKVADAQTPISLWVWRGLLSLWCSVSDKLPCYIPPSSHDFPATGKGWVLAVS